MNLQIEDEKKAEAPERIAHLNEEASREVWAGSNEKLLGFLADALRENGILVCMGEDVTETKVYVCQTDEARAGEIVREVVEGTLPEQVRKFPFSKLKKKA